MLKNTPLSGVINISLFLYPLKDTLLAFKFWQLWIKLLLTSLYWLGFQSLWVNAKENDCWIPCQEYVWFCKKLLDCVPKWLYHFAFPPEMNGCSCCSASSPVSDVVSVLYLGHSNRCAVVSCFHLQFPEDIGCGASFHVCIYHLYIFFSEESIRSFSRFKINLFVFLLLNVKNSLYILDNNS